MINVDQVLFLDRFQEDTLTLTCYKKILTCYKGQCPVSKCDLMGHEAFLRLRILPGPTVVCNP